MKQYILSLDQGTSSSRAIVFDQEGNICSTAQHEFPQIFPQSGWVEHDPLQIWGSQASVIAEAISQIGVNGKNIAAIGITNQRETTIVWDAETGEPVYNAIVWQDRRTSEYCDTLREEGLAEKIRAKTGLIVDAYFSATKVIQEIHDAATAQRSDVIVLCHGGPISSPEDAQYILRNTKGVHGFYGASSAERMPVETAIKEHIQKFKSITF